MNKKEQNSETHLENKRTHWYPILIVKDNIILGISKSNKWIINITREDFSNETISLEFDDAYISILPILQKDFSTIISIIERRFNEYHLMLNGFENFPFLIFIEKIFKYQEVSVYWIELAFKWFKEFPIFYKNIFIKNLNNMMLNKSYSQKFRHDIKKELSKIKKEFKMNINFIDTK